MIKQKHCEKKKKNFFEAEAVFWDGPGRIERLGDSVRIPKTWEEN